MFDITKFEKYEDFVKYAIEVKEENDSLTLALQNEINLLTILLYFDETWEDKKLLSAASRIVYNYTYSEKPIGRAQRAEFKKAKEDKAKYSQILEKMELYKKYILWENKYYNKENYTNFMDYYAQVSYEALCAEQFISAMQSLWVEQFGILMTENTEKFVAFSELPQYVFEQTKALVLSDKLKPKIERKENRFNTYGGEIYTVDNGKGLLL